MRKDTYATFTKKHGTAKRVEATLLDTGVGEDLAFDLNGDPVRKFWVIRHKDKSGNIRFEAVSVEDFGNRYKPAP